MRNADYIQALFFSNFILKYLILFIFFKNINSCPFLNKFVNYS